MRDRPFFTKTLGRLIDYAWWQFECTVLEPSGLTKGQTIEYQRKVEKGQTSLPRRKSRLLKKRERAEKKEDEVVEEQDPKGRIFTPKSPEIPKEMAYIWHWYCKLASFRKYADGRAEPITPENILSWAALMRKTGKGAPSPFEAEAIFSIDRLYLDAFYRTQSMHMKLLQKNINPQEVQAKHKQR